MQIFLSYSHQDTLYFDRIRTHLKTLERVGNALVWEDKNIVPGETWETSIDEKLRASDIFLCLVSANFLASDFCMETELKIALELQKQGKIRIIPIIIDSCDWTFIKSLSQFQALPGSGKPISNFLNQEDAYTQVVQKIRQMIEQSNSSTQKNFSRTEGRFSTSVNSYSLSSSAEPHSNPFRIPVRPTDYEKMKFQREGYELLLNKFKNNLADLQKANPNIEYDLQTESNSFFVAIYVNGKKNATPHFANIEDQFGGIMYNANGNIINGNSRSMNHYFRVEETDGQLYFKGWNVPENLSAEGMAQYFWNMVFDSLKN